MSKFMRKYVHFMFWPSSRIKNDKVRHTMYVISIVANAYRFTKAYDKAVAKTRANQVHLAMVDHAIKNDLVNYGDADDQWLRDQGIQS
jgi:hypothetical protein